MLDCEEIEFNEFSFPLHTSEFYERDETYPLGLKIVGNNNLCISAVYEQEDKAQIVDVNIPDGMIPFGVNILALRQLSAELKVRGYKQLYYMANNSKTFRHILEAFPPEKVKIDYLDSYHDMEGGKARILKLIVNI